MRAPYRILTNRRCRWLTGLLVGFVACVILLPMPVSLVSKSGPGKDLSEPFPCQNRPCGCRSAEQCWKKCCCFSNTEKVAWAQTNGVKLPDYVVVAARKEVRAKKNSCALCAKENKKSSKTTRATSKVSVSSQPQKATPQAPVSRLRSSSSKWVMTMYAAECQGQAPFSFSFPASIIPRPVVAVTQAPCLLENVHPQSERLNSATARPPLPPPKIV